MTDNPFSKGYKESYEDFISDACGEGRHSECTEDFTRCRCTVRAWHRTPHVYMNTPIVKEGSEGRG